MNGIHKKWFEAEENLKSTVYSSTSSKIKVTQAVGRPIRDFDVPDGPIVIDKDLLQRVYDQLAFIAWDKAHSGCEDLQKELDSLYPYLNQ